MPITPHFTLSQDANHVTVNIRVPHVRVSVNSVEVVVDGPVLHFSSPPYLLVLTFPHPFEQGDDGECAQYDPLREGGMVSLSLRKQESGVMWPDLDLTGALVSPKSGRGAAAPIGRVGGAGISIVSSQDNTEERSTEDKFGAATAVPILPDWKNATRPHYGFLNQHAGVFNDLAREGLAAEMLQLPNPDETDTDNRKPVRLQRESEDFDADRYLGDIMIDDDYIYQSAMAMEPHWKTQSGVDSLMESLATLTTDELVPPGRSTFFSKDESAQLAAIPYPLLPETISPRQHDSLTMGMLDILYAYVYDHLLTDGDPTIESSWTVCILSCTLSWLEEYCANSDRVESVLRSSARRTLIYPYLRNLDLVRHCWDQVQTILQQGRRCIIRCFLQVRSILDKSESHYLGNRLYIDHYLAWLQRRVTCQQIDALDNSLSCTLAKGIEKGSLCLNLDSLENQLDEGSCLSANSDENSDTGDNSEATRDSSDDSSVVSAEQGSQNLNSDELLDSNLGRLVGVVEETTVGGSTGAPRAKLVLIQELE